jgi:hypothetical protein
MAKRIEIAILAILAFCNLSGTLSAYSVVFKWKQIDFKFPSEQARNQSLSSGQFIPENCLISGIKICGKRIYLTTPRFRLGSPATLAYLDMPDNNNPNTFDGKKNISKKKYDYNLFTILK